MTIDSGATAWVLVSAALVLFMTPGLAFFYGGMVRSKNVLGMLMQNIFAMGLITILWATVGFSLAFGGSGKYFGNFDFMFLKDVANIPNFPGYVDDFALIIPPLAFVVYQMMFAIITPGLVVGAVAERIRFTSYILFIVLFSLLVYAPIAHWVWHPDGFLFKMGGLDFAGGAVVHISAGMAALAGALVLKRRQTHLKGQEIPPANIPYVLIGTGLLWFGWFGFNAGSALGANALAVSAFATTNVSGAAGGLSWMFFDVV